MTPICPCLRYKLVVVGGGAGGCSVAAKFTKKLGKGQVAVIEPATVGSAFRHEDRAGWAGRAVCYVTKHEPGWSEGRDCGMGSSVVVKLSNC